jgi:hypothetical protein
MDSISLLGRVQNKNLSTITGYSYNESNKMHCFSNLFDSVLYMFRTCPLSSIRSISTLYTHNRYLSCQFCWCLLADTPDDGQWTCPKHVEYFIK